MIEELELPVSSPAHAHLYAPAGGDRFYERRHRIHCRSCGHDLSSRKSQKLGICGMCERFPPAPEVRLELVQVGEAIAYTPRPVED